METRSDTQFEGLWPLLESAFDGVLIVSPNSWLIERVNAAGAEWLGETASNLNGVPIGQFFAATSQDILLDRLERAWKGHLDNQPALVHLEPRKGRERLVGLRAYLVSIEREQMVGVYLHSVHMTEERFFRMDPLTGQPDRSTLEANLKTLFEARKSSDKQFAILFVDLDNFKAVNDAYGHIVSDKVLKEAAWKISKSTSRGAKVVRYGGDEFVVLMEDVANPAEVEAMRGRIRDAFSDPISVPQGEVLLSVSIGVAVATSEHRTPEDLLVAADRAMYAAKRDKQVRAIGGAAGEGAR